MSEKYALYEISYANTILYSRATPMPFDGEDENEPLFSEKLDACNPDNFEDFEGEQVVKKI